MTRLSDAEARRLGLLPPKPAIRRQVGHQKGPSESDILRTVRDYLRATGWYVVRIQQGLGCHKGIADLYAIRNGVQIWIEVKTAHGRLSEHQERFRDEIETHGGRYVVARGVEDVTNLSQQGG